MQKAMWGGGSVLTIMVGNLASKGLGVFREVAFAAWFGTGDIAAAFRIAQTASLLPSHALIGDTLSAGLLPLYRQSLSKDRDRARLLVLIATAYGVAFSAVVSALLYVFADVVATIVAPGASAAALTLAAGLLKILAFATPFHVLGGLLSYVEAGHGRFGAIASRPILLNVGSIAGAALAVVTGIDHWLATGLLLSHIAFFGWTVVELRRLDRFLPEQQQSMAVMFETTRRFFLNMAPLIGLPLVAQLNVLVERIVSSKIGTEVIPSVDYARVIADTAVQLIAVPLGILTMSLHGGSSSAEARKHVYGVTAAVMLLSFPASAYIAQNAESIVRLLFARGAFGTESVEVTSSILRWMGGCLGATVTAYYLVKALNAQLRNIEALIFTIVACVANMLVNFLLWTHLGPQTIGVAVAAHASILSILCIARLGFWRDLLPLAGWLALGLAAQIILSGFLASGFAYPFNLLVSGFVSACIWLILVALGPPLREAAKPIFSRVPLIRSRLR